MGDAQGDENCIFGQKMRKRRNSVCVCVWRQIVDLIFQLEQSLNFDPSRCIQGC